MWLGALLLAAAGAAASGAHGLLLNLAATGSVVVQTRQQIEADAVAYSKLFAAMRSHRDADRRIRRRGRRPAVLPRGLVALSVALLAGGAACGSSGDPARDPCHHVSAHGPLPCQTSTAWAGVPR